MADVARAFVRSALASTVSDGDVGRQRTRQRSRRARVGEETERSARSRHMPNGHYCPNARLDCGGTHQTRYTLDLIAGPPPYAQAGQPLVSGLQLQVRATPAVSSAARMDLALGRLFAVASLVAADLAESSQALDSSALAGHRLMDVVHPLSMVDDGEDENVPRALVPSPQVLGFLSFPDLVVRSPGTFRVRVTLLKVVSADEHNQSRFGGMALNAVDTSPIVVV